MNETNKNNDSIKILNNIVNWQHQTDACRFALARRALSNDVLTFCYFTFYYVSSELERVGLKSL